MESRKFVFKEVTLVAIGQVIGTTIMIGIFALLGKYDMSVLLGGILGSVLAVGNFFALAVVTTRAADRAEKQDVQGGVKMVQGSYPVRMLLLAGALFLCAKSGYCNVLALALPLLFTRPTITIAEFFRKKGD